MGVRASQDRALPWEQAITAVFAETKEEGDQAIIAMTQRSDVAYREDGEGVHRELLGHPIGVPLTLTVLREGALRALTVVPTDVP
jgi:hypothetical protein